MAEVIGGKSWKPYDAAGIAKLKATAASSTKDGAAPLVGEDATLFQQRSPLDLANPRLRKLAAALGAGVHAYRWHLGQHGVFR